LILIAFDSKQGGIFSPFDGQVDVDGTAHELGAFISVQSPASCFTYFSGDEE
jgi:hypothetical protein